MFTLWRKMFGSRKTDQAECVTTSAPSNDYNKLVISKKGYTFTRVSTFNFTWTISNFSFCSEKTGEALKSPEFSTDVDGPKFSLYLYPNGFNEECRDHIALFLHVGYQTKLKVKYSISLLKRGVKVSSGPRNEEIFEQTSLWGFRKFIPRNVLLKQKNRFLQDDKLTIFCEIETCVDRKNMIIFDNEQNADAAHHQPHIDDALKQFRVPECELSDDLERLLDCSSELCDVILVASGGERIGAHKLILMARSPVFAAMFQHEMAERKLNEVNIVDIEPDVLRGMLEYIYTGQKPTRLEEIAEGLLAAADKYDLKRLKVISEDVLTKKISKDSVADILILAYLHNAEHLKQQAINFVKKFGAHTELFKSESGTILVSMYPQLIKEALNLPQ